MMLKKRLKKIYKSRSIRSYGHKIEDFYGLKQYTMEMMDICMSTSRYKEATQFYKKYQKEVNRISNIMYD